MTMYEIKRAEFAEIANEIAVQDDVYVVECDYEQRIIKFVYGGYLWCVKEDAYYQTIVYTVYEITGTNRVRQVTYPLLYGGFEKLKVIKMNTTFSSEELLGWRMSEEWDVCKEVIMRQAGYREKEIVWNGAFAAKGEIWNDKHKVVKILSLQVDEDGHRDGFQVDIVTRRICG